VPPLAPGASATVSIDLPAGAWDLEVPYISPLPLEVTTSGLHATLPANLERPGPRWPIGRVSLSRAESLKVTFRLDKPWLAPLSDVATPGVLIATPVVSEQTVPMVQACGKPVDWFTPDGA
jgi:hypothetical protein